MVSRWAKALAVLMVLALFGAACGKKSESAGEGGGGKITIGSEQANDHGSSDVAGNTGTELELDSFYFKPTVLKGTAGQQLKLELSNDSSTLHNFSTAGGTDQDVSGGQKVDVTVTLPQSGTMIFFCKYHRASGMLGELSVGG